MTQHAGLTQERWSAFTLDQQILMIGNEMNRAAKLVEPLDRERLRNAYSRVLALTDLTIQGQRRRTFRRELLRWRDLIAGLYIADAGDPARHAAAFRCLLRFTSAAARQIPILAATRALDMSSTDAQGKTPSSM
jgi:hypothetical protein